VPLRSYGVLKATIERRTRATTRSDHYTLACSSGWEVSINAHSDVPPSDVAFAAFKATNHPLAKRLATFKAGWHRLRPGDGLDYVRGGLCRPEQFRALPISKPGANNDLNELFDRHLPVNAIVHAFGEPYAGGGHKGVHDVHQNQGNIGPYRDDDGVWQDGGLLIENQRSWVAILLRFQSQAWNTDDSTGHVH